MGLNELQSKSFPSYLRVPSVLTCIYLFSVRYLWFFFKESCSQLAVVCLMLVSMTSGKPSNGFSDIYQIWLEAPTVLQ